MRIALIQFPGTNCERETRLALQRVGLNAVDFFWNQKNDDLLDFDGYILAGGFSYEDRSRSGIIAAMDPLIETLRKEGLRGKPILGICNGAQILVESGLVPGLKDNQVGIALTDNKRLSSGKILGTGYYNAWVYIRLNKHHQAGAFTRHLSPQSILHVPVAHGEGRFLIPNPLLQEMEAEGLNLFQYCSSTGEVQADFPVNPNGSVHNLAAITNKMGNIMAMMPHPERTSAGDAIFRSMRDYIEEGRYPSSSFLSYEAPKIQLQAYSKGALARELLVELLITDNQALSVNQALHRADLPVSLTRQTHWEIECDSLETYQKIIESELLYNPRKELSLDIHSLKALPKEETVFLVRAKEDWIGRQKKQMLETHFGISGIQAIRHGVLWRVPKCERHDELTQRVIHSHLLFNLYAHDCYHYTN